VCSSDLPCQPFDSLDNYTASLHGWQAGTQGSDLALGAHSAASALLLGINTAAACTDFQSLHCLAVYACYSPTGSNHDNTTLLSLPLLLREASRALAPPPSCLNSRLCPGWRLCGGWLCTPALGRWPSLPGSAGVSEGQWGDSAGQGAGPGFAAAPRSGTGVGALVYCRCGSPGQQVGRRTAQQPAAGIASNQPYSGISTPQLTPEPHLQRTKVLDIQHAQNCGSQVSARLPS